jgi:hypothetical protein
MKKVSKRTCSLEEEYAFEHKARIKAEDYISELWEMHGELENEVLKLQNIINKGEHLKKEKPLLNTNLKLKTRLKKMFDEKKKTEKNLKEIIRRTFK